MALMNREAGDYTSPRGRRMEDQVEQDVAGAATAPAETPAEAPGSQAPPPDAGDEAPDRNFPVPPVPPPPSPGPIFSLAGGGGGGASSFARPGTEAARPFRSPIFTANRSTAMPGRFGAGTTVAGGGGTPFLPVGLDAGESGGPEAPADELARILAMMRGGGRG
jgi:hypothetical protein